MSNRRSKTNNLLPLLLHICIHLVFIAFIDGQIYLGVKSFLLLQSK